MELEEEQVFWLMCYCFENILPKNYYINLLPLLADIKLMKYILREKMEKITRLMEELKIDLNFLVASWFMLIFINTAN